MEETLIFGTLKVHCFAPSPEKAESVCYLHGEKQLARRLAKALETKNVGVFAIEGENWNADLSPWPAPAVFKGESDFLGGADEYLQFLQERVIAPAEKTLEILVKKRALIGYSLAGLFSVYALYKTELFTDIASVSGSFWYPGFLEYMQQTEMVCKPNQAYLSVGKKEKKTRNALMAQVEARTLQAKKRLDELGVSCFFEFNQGNHFTQMDERMEKAARRLFL